MRRVIPLCCSAAIPAGRTSGRRASLPAHLHVMHGGFITARKHAVPVDIRENSRTAGRCGLARSNFCGVAAVFAQALPEQTRPSDDRRERREYGVLGHPDLSACARAGGIPLGLCSRRCGCGRRVRRVVLLQLASNLFASGRRVAFRLTSAASLGYVLTLFQRKDVAAAPPWGGPKAPRAEGRGRVMQEELCSLACAGGAYC